MIERDYIMRMIDLLVKALTKALLHKKAYEYPQAKQEIAGAYKSLLGVSPEFIHSFSDEQLMGLLGKDVETVGVKCYILGSLLKEEADIYRISKEEGKSISVYAKSLSLLLTAFLDTSVPIEPEHPTKIDACVQALRSVEIPQHILEKLFAFYEIAQRYDKAEDVLFDLVTFDTSVVISGLAFYERLLNKSSDELTAGGLPRNEVLDGIDTLKKERLSS
jgi:hypothetical protein